MWEERVDKKPQQQRSRGEVERLLNAFERSGLRRREFCLKHGVALGTLDFWRKRRGLERERAVSAACRGTEERKEFASIRAARRCRRNCRGGAGDCVHPGTMYL